MRRLGILTGGGDAPGINPTIKWVVKHALDERVADEIVGIHYGYKGLLTKDVVLLTEKNVRTWDRDGGTNLGSSRTNLFNDDGIDKSEEAIGNIATLGIDKLIAIGGEDTLSAAYRLFQKGVRIVGIPKTIDKDVLGTDYTLGFATAVEELRQLINKLRNPAGSHGIIYMVETMGRHAGHLALYSGMAGAAAVILIPEYDFDIHQVTERLRERRKNGARYDIVVVAEAAKPIGKSEITADSKTCGYGHIPLGGIGALLAKEIERLTGYETRDNKPGHVQRGERPNFYDVIIGRLFGIGAVELLKKGEFGRMISYKDGRISDTPLEEVTHGWKLVDVERHYDTKRLTAKRTSDFSLF
ncbi:MAG: ATP-dependent 6-phosphofructokinase [Nanoarchaeota archaeon]